jgi:hypothetical protein
MAASIESESELEMTSLVLSKAHLFHITAHNSSSNFKEYVFSQSLLRSGSEWASMNENLQRAFAQCISAYKTFAQSEFLSKHLVATPAFVAAISANIADRDVPLGVISDLSNVLLSAVMHGGSGTAVIEHMITALTSLDDAYIGTGPGNHKARKRYGEAMRNLLGVVSTIVSNDGEISNLSTMQILIRV